jgi:hypothetical protein
MARQRGAPTRNPTPSMGSDECSLFSEKMVGPGSFSENGLFLLGDLFRLAKKLARFAGVAKNIRIDSIHSMIRFDSFVLAPAVEDFNNQQ